MSDNEEVGIDINESDLENQNDESYSQALTWSTDWTTETIVRQIEKGAIDLNPAFQRRNAWDNAKQSALIESLILGIPIPQIILAEKKDKKNTYIVIDGKQRLLAIKRFFTKSSDESTDYKPLKLAGLNVVSKLNGKTYEKLSADALLCDYIDRIENQTIRTVVIKGWPNEEYLYTVFLRLNTGSVRLSPQELRQALHPGDFLSFINEYTMSDNPLRKILNIKEPDKRMRDVEYILRYFSYKNFLSEYDGSIKKFLDNTCKILNERFTSEQRFIKNQIEEFEKSIEFVYSVFNDNCFRSFIKGEYSKNLNRTIYDLFVVYFSIQENRIALESKKNDVKLSFENLMSTDTTFTDYISSGTNSKIGTDYRFDTFNTLMDGLK